MVQSFRQCRRAFVRSAAAVLLACGAATSGFAPSIVSAAPAAAQTLKIGVLPAADSVLLYAAEAEGFFKAKGLDVKLLPFKSAIEIGAAMRAGELSGHYGDLINVFTQNATGAPQAVVATMTYANKTQRNFALVARPGAKVSSLDDLKANPGTDTAMSASTIIDYLLDRMDETTGLPESAMKRVEVRQIPIRLQLLLSGKMDTALLPEPLCSLVESKGGKALWDDRELAEPLAVVALRQADLKPETVAAFKGALTDAAKAIEADPEKFRALMVKKSLLTKQAAAGYHMPKYAHFGTSDGLPPLPSAADVKRTGDWMMKKGMLKSVPPFEAVIHQ